jgi:serine/threonine protein kinase
MVIHMEQNPDNILIGLDGLIKLFDLGHAIAPSNIGQCPV